MRFLYLPWALLLAGAAPGQAVTAIPQSQANSAAATLLISGAVHTAGGITTPFVALTAASSSRTVSTVATKGGVPSPGPSVELDCEVRGTPNVPVAILGWCEASPLECPFPPAGCGASAWSPWNQATPVGTLHLPATPVAIFDGLGLALNAAPPAALDGQGRFAHQALVPWGLNSAVAAPYNFAFQALVTDPAAPEGLRLTAAVTLARWLSICPVCVE